MLFGSTRRAHVGEIYVRDIFYIGNMQIYVNTETAINPGSHHGNHMFRKYIRSIPLIVKDASLNTVSILVSSCPTGRAKFAFNDT